MNLQFQVSSEVVINILGSSYGKNRWVAAALHCVQCNWLLLVILTVLCLLADRKKACSLFLMVHIKALLQKSLPRMPLQCACLRRKDLKCWLLSPFQRILAYIVCFRLRL